jgi:hypothetical protein
MTLPRGPDIDAWAAMESAAAGDFDAVGRFLDVYAPTDEAAEMLGVMMSWLSLAWDLAPAARTQVEYRIRQRLTSGSN